MNIYIVEAKRTPIGKYLGQFSDMGAAQLLQPLMNWYTANYPNLKKAIDGIYVGNVIGAGVGMNIGRATAVRAGFDESTPALMVNQVCGSGLAAVIFGYMHILAGQAQLVLAGGVESMSTAPYLLFGHRKGVRYGEGSLIDALNHDGLYCQLAQGLMGEKVELIIEKYSINRKIQDLYALNSHKKALMAQRLANFTRELVAIINNNDQKIVVDEQPRKDTSLEKLLKLRPVFTPNGHITAGNASPLNDGAAMLLLASEAAVVDHELKPLAKILAIDTSGIDPEYAGMGAAVSIRNLLNTTDMKVDDIDLFEINEAFAAQILAVMQVLGVDQKKVNVYGGALALGHPLGASGARILTTLVHALQTQKKRLGIASLCVGGGQGVSILVEHVK